MAKVLEIRLEQREFRQMMDEGLLRGACLSETMPDKGCTKKTIYWSPAGRPYVLK